MSDIEFDDHEMLELEDIFIELDMSNFIDDEEDVLSIDERIFEDEPVDMSSCILETPIRFSTPSIVNLIKRSGIIDENGIPKGITNSAAKYISNIVYTKLQSILVQCLVIMNEHDAKVLTHHDVIKILELTGETIIYPQV